MTRREFASVSGRKMLSSLSLVLGLPNDRVSTCRVSVSDRPVVVRLGNDGGRQENRFGDIRSVDKDVFNKQQPSSEVSSSSNGAHETVQRSSMS